MFVKLINELQDQGVLAAVAVATDAVVQPSSDRLRAQIELLIEERKLNEFPPPDIKDAVRNLLKTGGFKPSGRNKPASEYLAQAAREGRFPFINNLVDINNLISLRTGLPMSLLDTEAVGENLLLRFGREGERYVFNSGGQEIELKGLICACNGDRDEPLGNAVKDSMTGKIKEHTKHVVAVIYAPSHGSLAQVAREQIEVFAQLLETEGRASSVQTFCA
jgi:DNA/RNA-binding domain of Phe-tRNA-synthetase-like protein